MGTFLDFSHAPSLCIAQQPVFNPRFWPLKTDISYSDKHKYQ
jgi:hypothetical protein